VGEGSDANSVSRPRALAHPTDGAFYMWIGRDGASMHRNDTHDFSKIWVNVGSHKPDVVVANMGLHWHHFHSNSRRGGKTTRADLVSRWIHYEDWLGEVVREVFKTGAKVLLFKTNNARCEEKFYGGTAKLNKLYRAKDNQTLSECRDYYASEMANHNTTPEEISSYCEYGTSNEIGTAYLNERLIKYLTQHNWLEGHNTFTASGESASKMRIGLFDDHAVQACSYSGDDTHFVELSLLRVRLLANLLECIGQERKG
jgi:hypothetical protein